MESEAARAASADSAGAAADAVDAVAEASGVTAAAFKDGWFVSGDMISFDEKGYVTYAGRSDDMLKISGKWLSPQELENCLLQHEAVREVAVVGIPTRDGLIKPSAFIIAERIVEEGDPLANELQRWAQDRLEPYKYP